MSGPLTGSTKTDLIGQGFRILKSATKHYSAKWGNLSTNPIFNNQVSDYSYSQEKFENSIVGSENLIAYWHEVTLPRVDTKMDPIVKYNLVKHPSPVIFNAKAAGSSKNFETHYGGPMYIELGIERYFEL